MLLLRGKDLLVADGQQRLLVDELAAQLRQVPAVAHEQLVIGFLVLDVGVLQRDLQVVDLSGACVDKDLLRLFHLIVKNNKLYN